MASMQRFNKVNLKNLRSETPNTSLRQDQIYQLKAGIKLSESNEFHYMHNNLSAKYLTNWNDISLVKLKYFGRYV